MQKVFVVPALCFSRTRTTFDSTLLDFKRVVTWYKNNHFNLFRKPLVQIVNLKQHTNQNKKQQKFFFLFLIVFLFQLIQSIKQLDSIKYYLDIFFELFLNVDAI